MAYAQETTLLGKAEGIDFNTTSDQLITITAPKYIIRRIVVTNASTNLNVAVGGIYTGASKTGSTIVDSTQTYTNLTTSAKFRGVTLGSICGTDTLSASTLYFSLTTAQGTAATADIYIMGERL